MDEPELDRRSNYVKLLAFIGMVRNCIFLRCNQ